MIRIGEGPAIQASPVDPLTALGLQPISTVAAAAPAVEPVEPEGPLQGLAIGGIPLPPLKKKRAPAKRKPKEKVEEVYTGPPLLTEELNDPHARRVPEIPVAPATPPTQRILMPHNHQLVIVTDARTNEIMDTIGNIMGAAVRDGLQVFTHHLDAKGEKPLPQFFPGVTYLIMGKTAYDRISRECGALAKNKSISAYRHTEVAFNGAVLLTTHSPYGGTKDYPTLVDIQLDTQAAVRRAFTGTIAPGGLGQYEWVDDFAPLCHAIHHEYLRTGQPVRVSWDLECVGLDEHDPLAWIVSIFFSMKVGFSTGMAFKWHLDQPCRADTAMFQGGKAATWDKLVLIWEQINWILNTPMVWSVGANLKFDKRWIAKKWNMECTNHRFDTTLVGGLLDENRSNSLNNHAKIYAPEIGGYDDYFNNTVDKGRMDLALAANPDEFKIYAGGDTDAALRIYYPLRDQLSYNERLTNLYINLVHPASDFFCRLEQVGVLVDQEEYARLGVELQEEIARLQSEADALFPMRLRAKHKGDTKLTKSAVIADYMFSQLGLGLRPLEFTAKTKNTPVPKPSTEYTHLVKFKGVHPDVAKFLEIYKAYNSASKTLTTYVTGFLSHLRSDGRFHATYLLHKSDKGGDTGETGGGTVTGRLACTGPAMQTVPSKTTWAKKLRKCFPAPPGYKAVEIDYSQGELRVAAVVAGVRAMIDSYNNNEDLHVLAGALAAGMNPEEVRSWKDCGNPELEKKYKFVRQNGKAANFGLLYGMSAEGYMNYARDSYGVEMTLDEAIYARQAFFDLYPELLDWHAEYQAKAARDGVIVSPLGRVRHLPFINSRDNSLRSQSERQAINSPIQATLSDMTVLSGIEFENNYGRFGRDNPVQFFMMVHDALYAYIKEDDIDIWVPRIVEIMENLPLAEKFGWYNIPLKFAAEPEAGSNLADKHELHFTPEHLRTVLKWAA